MSEVNIITWVSWSEVAGEQADLQAIREDFEKLPAHAAAVSICQMLFAEFRDEDQLWQYCFEQFLSPETRKFVLAELSRGKRRVVFHRQQLEIALAYALRYGDFSNSVEGLSEPERFWLGDACLMISDHCMRVESELQISDPGGMWADVRRVFAATAMASNFPANGFMRIYRAHQILFHCLPKAAPGEDGKSRFEVAFDEQNDVSFRRLWSFAAFLLQSKTPPGGKNLESRAFVRLKELETFFGWARSEREAFERLLCHRLEPLSGMMPDDPIDSYDQVVQALRERPILLFPDSTAYADPVLLADGILSAFYRLLRSGASETGGAGTFDEAFGRAVEHYVENLMALAGSAVGGRSDFGLAKIRGKGKTKGPEWEVGTGRVRQLIEVKGLQFETADLYRPGGGRAALKALSKLSSGQEGVGQLAQYAARMYADAGRKDVVRFQSLLVVLDRLPTFVPDFQLAMKREYERLLFEWLGQNASELTGDLNLGPAHIQFACISMDEFELMMGVVVAGREFSDLCDAVFAGMQKTSLGLVSVWDEVSRGMASGYAWLGATWDDLFGFYRQHLAPATKSENLESTENSIPRSFNGHGPIGIE